MKNQIIVLAAVVSVFSISCKKSNSTTTGGGNTNNNTTSNIYGYLNAEKNLNNNVITGIPDTSYNALAYFFSTGQPSYNLPTNPAIVISAGAVKLNSTRLQLVNYGFLLYGDSTYTLNLRTNQSWQVAGAGAIPAFSYTPSVGWSSFTGYAQLPDTIFHTQNNVIHISGITNADSVSVSLNDGTYTTGHYLTSKPVTPSTTTITFTSASLAAFTPTTAGNLNVNIYRFTTNQTFGSKSFVFVNSLQFSKTVVVN